MYHTTNKISATIFYEAVNLGFEGTNKWKGRNSKKKNEYMKMDIWLHMIGQNTRENIDGMLVKEKI